MTPLLFLIAHLTLFGAPSAAQDNEARWRLGGRADQFAFDTGTVAIEHGAQLTLRALHTESRSGTLAKTLPAAPWHLHRVRVSGQIRTTEVSQSASLWMRADGETGMLILDNGMDRGLRNTTDWSDFSVTMVVPPNAARVVVGLLLVGQGEMAVRNFRVQSLGALDPKASIAAEPRQLLDSAITLAKRRSVWRDTITWKTVEQDVRMLAVGAESVQHVYPAIRMLVARLGDNHSQFFTPQVTRQVQSGGAANPPVEVKAIDGGIGYIMVPGYSGVEQTAATRYRLRFHELLESTLPSVRCGWVVDLRRNTGGNMHPMLAGLSPFLGTGVLGYFVAPGIETPWRAVSSDEQRGPKALDVLGKAPVAVITGPRTASSGEIVAISFIGRDHTRSFGEPTGGYSTANSMISLPFGHMLNLTTAIDADRRKQKYGGRIMPDEQVPASDTGDEALAKAKEWLQQQTGCTR